jgi:superfamily II DNA or RNA helicase
VTGRPHTASSFSNLTADARSVLMDTVRKLPLDSHFSRATLKAADDFVLPSKYWRSPLAWFRPDGSQADTLQCEMTAGPGDPRLVNVHLYWLFGTIAVESTCTCGRSLCAHAAAILIRLQRLLDWPRAMTPLQRWQQSLQTNLAASIQAPSLQTLEFRQVVCLLQVIHDRQPSILVGRLILIWAAHELHQPERWRTVEDALSDSHVLPQVLTWHTRLTNGPRNPRSNQPGHVLQGPPGARLLEEWLAAGICHHAETLQRVSAGPARPPRWRWTHDHHAQAHIALDFPDDQSARLIDLERLYYLDESSGTLGQLTIDRATWTMLAQMPPIPPTERELLATWPPHPLLAGIPPPPPPPALREIHATLEPILVIGASRRSEREEFVFYLHAWADYSGIRLPLADEPWQHSTVRSVSDEFVTVFRQLDDEVSAFRALTQTDIIDLAKLVPDAWRTLVPAPAVRALGHRQHYRGGADTFTALESIAQSLSRAGFRYEFDPDLPFAVLPPETELRATLSHSEQVGWTQFQLGAVFEGGEINVLPIILKGLTRKAFSLTPTPNEPPDAHWLAPIGSKRFLSLRLSQLREWLGPLLEYLDAPHRSDPNHLKLSRSQAMALSESLRRHGVDVQGPAAANTANTLAALRAAQRSAVPTAGPHSFRGTLRHYQREGLQWLQALRAGRLGGVLADDMGLGKTVQIIAHLLLEEESGRLNRPALIVVPTSLVFNWIDEMMRFAPALRCLNFTGSERLAQRDRLSRAQVIVTSYSLLISELGTLEDIEYSMLVLDEAQWIKNPLAQTARAVRCLRASHRLAVTGTPLENHLGELWAHMDAVLPGYLGDYRSFNRSFRIPIERQEDDARGAILRQRIAPFLLRRTKAAVAPELPPKTETVLRVAMGETQRRLYESLRLSLSDEVRAALASYSEQQSRIVVLSALLRLRQVCCDPRLIGKQSDPPPGSAKLGALLELIGSLREEGRHVLVFSQFTSMLELISESLQAKKFEHAVLTGKTLERATPVRRFQSGAVKILLASLKAGGVGLNLTAADAVIHYDPWWNPAVERQAVDRAHRLGREQPVFVYKLLCDDTIEEKIAVLKDRKNDLADVVLGNDSSASAQLTELDVRSLFDLPTLAR